MAEDRLPAPKGPGGGPREPSVRRGRAYFQEVLTELQKTTWPTRQEAGRITMVVIAVIVVIGAYMGALDWFLSTIVSKLSLIK